MDQDEQIQLRLWSLLYFQTVNYKVYLNVRIKFMIILMMIMCLLY